MFSPMSVEMVAEEAGNGKRFISVARGEERVIGFVVVRAGRSAAW